MVVGKDSTEQLFLDRRKHIERTLDVTVTKKGVSSKVAIDNIVKDSFRYQEQGSSSREKIFGFCANPMLNISFYDVELEPKDTITVNFILDSLADPSAKDTIPIGSFEIDNVKKDVANRIYEYTAYNYVVKPSHPNRFDMWRLTEAHTNTEAAHYEMSFGILNAKCGIYNYLSGYTNTSLKRTTKTEFLSDIYDHTQVALLEYDVLTETNLFEDPNKIYKVFKNALVRHQDYIQACNLMSTYCDDYIPFINYKELKAYPYVANQLNNGDKTESVYRLFDNYDEEELFLKTESGWDNYGRKIVIAVPKALIVWNPDTQTQTRYGIFTDATYDRFIQVASGHSSEFGNGQEYNGTILKLPYDSSYTEEDDDDDFPETLYAMSYETAKNLDFSSYLNDAYELLGKKVKPAKNVQGKKVTEGQDVYDTSHSNKLYPENALFPDDNEYPHMTSKHGYYQNAKQDIIYSPESCENLELNPEVYQYSGIRIKTTDMEFTYFFDQEHYSAPYHIYDLTNNQILQKADIWYNEIIDILNLGFIPNVKSAKSSKIAITGPANAMSELNDTIHCKNYYDEAEQDYEAPIYSRVLKGEQFVFEEIETAVGEPNINEDDWKKDIQIFVEM